MNVEEWSCEKLYGLLPNDFTNGSPALDMMTISASLTKCHDDKYGRIKKEQGQRRDQFSSRYKEKYKYKDIIKEIDILFA